MEGAMAGRPKNPDTDYKVIIHQPNGYRYAATQPHIKDPKTGVTRRRYCYWGDVSEDLKFFPNDRFLLASPSERARLIFPEGWDLSEIQSLCTAEDAPPVMDPCLVNDGSAFTGTVRLSPATDQYNNRFYGGTWFLWGIAVNKHIVEDLLKVFHDDLVAVNDILTLAMFPIITKKNYNQVERWQGYTKAPSTHPLSPSFITRFTQKITDNHRMQFLKLRINRQAPKALVACDSTTRSAYGKCLADIRWGKNKDNEQLQNTLEVVVYSLNTHEPIYYRTSAGNENDSRTLRTIITDLQKLGCTDLMVVFDRGYETDENVTDMIRHDQSFLICGKVGQKPVYSSIQKVLYDADGLPANMSYYPKEHVYTAQFEENRTLLMDPEDPGSQKTVTLKVNLYLDMADRMEELTRIKEAVREEESCIKAFIASGKEASVLNVALLQKVCPYHALDVDPETDKLVCRLKDKQVTKAMNTAGFFSSVSYKIEGGAAEQMALYALRDEQEKYFEEMKEQLGFSVQRNSSEDGKTGRLFILFIGLILHSQIRRIWSQKLKKDYPSSVDVLHEMLPVRYAEYADGSSHVTGFTDPQVAICKAFDLPVPEECLSATQKAVARRNSGGKRGRPKGTVNKPKGGN